jgi:hypothetical protein
MPELSRRKSTASLAELVSDAGIAWKKRTIVCDATSDYSKTEKAFGFLDRYFANGLVGGASSLSVEHLITDCINAGLKEQQIDDFEDFCSKYGGSVTFPEFLELMFISAAKWHGESYQFEWKKMRVGRDDGEAVNGMSRALWQQLFDSEDGKWPTDSQDDDKKLKVKWTNLRKLLADPNYFPFEVTRTETFDLIQQAADVAEMVCPRLQAEAMVLRIVE